MLISGNNQTLINTQVGVARIKNMDYATVSTDIDAIRVYLKDGLLETSNIILRHAGAITRILWLLPRVNCSSFSIRIESRARCRC